MGLTDRSKTAENLVDSRKNEKKNFAATLTPYAR